MATVIYSQTANMASPYSWQPANTTYVTPTQINLTDNAGFSAVFYGAFSYGSGYLDGGTVTGYDIYHNGAIEYTVRNISLEAISVNNYVANRDAIGLQQFTLSGNDVIGPLGNGMFLGSIGDDIIIGTQGNDNLNGWTGGDILKGGAGNDSLYGGLGRDIYIVTSGSEHSVAEFFDTDPSFSADQARFSSTINGDTLTLFANDIGLEYAVMRNDVSVDHTGDHNFSTTALNINASAVANALIIEGNYGNNILIGTAYDDWLLGDFGNDTLDGGAGFDTAYFNILISDISNIRYLKTGGILITSTMGSDTLFNIENLSFGSPSYPTITVQNFITIRPIPTYSSGISGSVTPTLYAGPVAFLEYQHIGSATGDVIVAAAGNDFLNLLGGDDAANGGAGDDVLDGGTGSNFITGGGDNDTLFLDGRGGTTTWSTVTDFNAGDEVNIWGWVEGTTSKLLLTEVSGGVDGYRGATYHYDLNNDNAIDTSITFTGLTIAQLPSAQALSVAGNGYLLIG